MLAENIFQLQKVMKGKCISHSTKSHGTEKEVYKYSV